MNGFWTKYNLLDQNESYVHICDSFQISISHVDQNLQRDSFIHIAIYSSLLTTTKTHTVTKNTCTKMDVPLNILLQIIIISLDQTKLGFGQVSKNF